MAEDKVYLATTKTGRDIYIGDETLEHMKAHSDVSMDHIKEAIEKNDTYVCLMRIDLRQQSFGKHMLLL